MTVRMRSFSLLTLITFVSAQVLSVGVVRAETANLQYDASFPLHAPKVVNGVNLQYDRNGNLENDGERVISWNQDNLPTKIIKDGVETNLFYDADGRRIVKQTEQEKTTYPNQYLTIKQFNNETISTKFYFAGDRRIALSSPRLAPSFYHQDYLGSTVLATDSNSTPISKSLSYFPYGNLIGESMSQRVSESMNYLYTGQELDDEVALYNYNARLYNPNTGVFVSADTAGGAFAYAAGNPLRFTDPSGNWAIEGAGYVAPSQDPDTQLQYTISGGGGSQTPTIGATGVINDANVVYTPQDISEEGKQLLISMIGYSMTVPMIVASIPALVSYLQFTGAYYYYNYFYSGRAAPAQVGQIVKSVDQSLINIAWEPRAPGARGGCCGLASNMVRFEAESSGASGRVYQVADIHRALGVTDEEAFRHGFAVVETGGSAYLVDLTFSQFMDPATGTIGQNPVFTGVSIGDPFAQRLLAQGYVELTQENFVRYLQLTSSQGVNAGSAATLDILGVVSPIEWDYTVRQLERLTGR